MCSILGEFDAEVALREGAGATGLGCVHIFFPAGREFNAKGGSSEFRIFNLHGAAVLDNEFSCDREANARSPLPLRARKGLEDSFSTGEGDSRAVIAEEHAGPVELRVVLGSDVNVAVTFRSGVNRVVQEIQECLVNRVGVDWNWRLILIYRKIDGDTAALGFCSEQVRNFLD